MGDPLQIEANQRWSNLMRLRPLSGCFISAPMSQARGLNAAHTLAAAVRAFRAQLVCDWPRGKSTAAYSFWQKSLSDRRAFETAQILMHSVLYAVQRRASIGSKAEDVLRELSTASIWPEMQSALKAIESAILFLYMYLPPQPGEEAPPDDPRPPEPPVDPAMERIAEILTRRRYGTVAATQSAPQTPISPSLPAPPVSRASQSVDVRKTHTTDDQYITPGVAMVMLAPSMADRRQRQVFDRMLKNAASRVRVKKKGTWRLVHLDDWRKLCDLLGPIMKRSGDRFDQLDHRGLQQFLAEAEARRAKIPKTPFRDHSA